MKNTEATPELIAQRIGKSKRTGRNPDELEVERMERLGILSIEQSMAGKRLYCWHHIATQTGLCPPDLSREVFGFNDQSPISRFNAADKYYKTMTQLRNTEAHKIIKAVAIEEKNLSQVHAMIKGHLHTVRKKLEDAFDKLVDAQDAVFKLQRDYEDS